MTRTTVVAETAQPGDALADLEGVHGLHTQDGQLRFEVDGDHVDAVLRRLSALGVRSIVAHPPSLEQLLMRHYGGDLPAQDRRERVGG
jgi:ABC-2 type transport system ATP-binding protein